MKWMQVQLPRVVDPISETLYFMRMTGTFYCQSEFTAPWALILPAMESCMMLHVVTSGRCLIEAGEQPARWLQPGDLALVPHGEGHLVASQRGLEGSKLFDLHHELVSERFETLQLGGGGERTTMVCGLFKFDHPVASQFIGLLPRVITIDGWASPHADWIQSTVRMISSEAGQIRPGGETVITRLADILIIQAIRSWLAQAPEGPTGWLAALRDPQIGPLLSRIHRDPTRPWTLDLLAAEASMSRSTFAARFTQLVGDPAMRYVARWRMNHAAERLRDHKMPIAEVAASVGYESEAAFNRAFKRHTGMSPGAARSSTAER